MCPHVETDTRGSSKTLVRHTCKACLKVKLELPRKEGTVRESTGKDVSQADTSQFRDISRAMHERPQMTLNAREVDLVLGLLTRNVHVHLSRFSSISGADFVSLLDDAIEIILDPTETVAARNTGTTITTNDTSSGAASSLSASQSGTVIQSKVLLEQHGAPMFSNHSRHSLLAAWRWIRDWPVSLDSLSNAMGVTSCLFARAAGHVFCRRCFVRSTQTVTMKQLRLIACFLSIHAKLGLINDMAKSRIFHVVCSSRASSMAVMVRCLSWTVSPSVLSISESTNDTTQNVSRHCYENWLLNLTSPISMARDKASPREASTTFAVSAGSSFHNDFLMR